MIRCKLETCDLNAAVPVRDRKYRLEVLRLGSISEVFKFMEEKVFTEWDRVANNLSLPLIESNGLAWGIKGHNYPWIIKNIKFSEKCAVADIGGGYSMLPVIINERYGSEVWVVDDFGVESEEPLWSRWGDRERHKAKHPNINYVFERLGTGASKSLRPDYYDVVYSVSALEHIPQNHLDSVFEHMLEILKPGGVLVHCIDVALCSSIGEAVRTIKEPSHRYASWWFSYLKNYFGESRFIIDDTIQMIDEIESSMNPDIVTDGPEIVFRYYHPNQKAKPYKRNGTLIFVVRCILDEATEETGVKHSIT